MMGAMADGARGSPVGSEGFTIPIKAWCCSRMWFFLSTRVRDPLGAHKRGAEDGHYGEWSAGSSTLSSEGSVTPTDRGGPGGVRPSSDIGVGPADRFLGCERGSQTRFELGTRRRVPLSRLSICARDWASGFETA